VRAFENCLVCGASTENTHSARRGEDALVCGGDCYQQASRNFKRRMNGYKVARIVDLLAQMEGPVSAQQLLDRFRNTYGKSAMIGFNTTTSLTQQFAPIFNPETIRVDKSRKPFTFEYLGGTTIGEWLKPSMRAKYESVTFGAESGEGHWTKIHKEYAPTELIIKRLKDSGVWELGDVPSAGDGTWDVIKWWATVRIKDGTLVRATEDEIGDLTTINIILLDGQIEKGYGRVTVEYTDIDNPDWEDSYRDEMEKLGKDLTTIFDNNGMFQSVDDNLQYGDMGEFYEVFWDDLIRHDCATNADLEVYEDDFIVMECNICGRTATFRQETPYEGPRTRKNAETFSSESQQKLDVAVGDRVRSYDFILPDGTLIRDDYYMEGRVTKIAPVDWCGSECDHYYILVDKIVRKGKELSERVPGLDMVYPPVNESYLEVISESSFSADQLEGCANCGFYPAQYTVEDLPVGPRNFCTEMCWAKYVGMPVKTEGYYGLDRMDEMDAETNEYKGPFEVEIRRPDGSKTSWKKYDTYKELIAALDEIVSQRHTPYAIDVFASRIPYVVGFNVTGPVTDYRKYHLGTWKYGSWESGPWIHHFPQGIE
jgi:hypothetical protein